jgi:hypothetical protein
MSHSPQFCFPLGDHTDLSEMILAEIYGKLIKVITARVFPHLQIGLMSRLLRAVVVGSVLGLCSASPAPDGTTSETTTMGPKSIRTN